MPQVEQELLAPSCITSNNPGDKSCKTYNDEEHLTNNTIFSTIKSPHMLMYVEKNYCIKSTSMGYVYIYRKKTQSIQLYETPLNVINSHIYEEPHNDETYQHID